MENLVALVTGGGSGIGFATAKLLLEQQARVIIVGRDSRRLKEAAATLNAPEDRLRYISGDVSSEGYANKLIRDTINVFGRLDILVNNAGVFRTGSLLEMTEEDFDYNIDVNLKGVWFMCKFAARALMASGGGSIVNVSSLLALQPFPHTPSSAYSAAKGGVLSLTRALAVELAPYKVRVNAVIPALIRTEMLDSVIGADLEKVMEKAKRTYPLGRIGEPDDVARAITFLANPANAWITGVEMRVDGGINLV